MVGVAFAIVISTMHNKIVQRFAQCTEIWKKFQNSIFHNHNDDITEVSQSFLSYHNFTTQLFRKLFLKKLGQNFDFTKHNLQNGHIISHLRIFAFIFFVDLVTPES